MNYLGNYIYWANTQAANSASIEADADFKMNVESAQYVKNLEDVTNAVKATINGQEWFVPINAEDISSLESRTSMGCRG